MFKRNKKYLAILGLLFIVSLPLQVHADIKSYKLEQGIPFIGGANTVLSYGDFNNLFQKFITAAYIIAAVAAFIKILIAGIRWYTSGGSPKAISQAKEDIKNGIIGLCFLFLAGVLLEFINPNLNKLSDIYSPHAGEECVQGAAQVNNSEGLGVIKGDPSFSGNDGIPLFNQRDAPWGNKPYPDNAHLFADGGCVPTSIAMVITKLTGFRVTPGDLYAKMVADNIHKYVVADGNSTNFRGMAALYGITGTMTSGSGISGCLANQGIPTVVVTGGEGPNDPCKQLLHSDGGGHMIVITGINSTDPSYYNVNDPYYYNTPYHKFIAVSADLLLNHNCVASYWCFTKKK